jgi:hypothetical protein
MTRRPLLAPCLRAPCLRIGLLALGLLGACAGPDPAVSPVYAGPRPGGAGQADQAAVVAACRRDADRIVTLRDRSQLMREDERDSRMGSQASIFSQRAETDRLGRIYDRDRIAADCVQQNSRSAPQR